LLLPIEFLHLFLRDPGIPVGKVMLLQKLQYITLVDTGIQGSNALIITKATTLEIFKTWHYSAKGLLVESLYSQTASTYPFLVFINFQISFQTVTHYCKVTHRIST
jgi:hypothetical protein